jgi:hypothetical protein
MQRYNISVVIDEYLGIKLGKKSVFYGAAVHQKEHGVECTSGEGKRAKAEKSCGKVVRVKINHHLCDRLSKEWK